MNRWWWLVVPCLLGSSSYLPPERVRHPGAVPLLSAPFTGTRIAAGLFDHDATRAEQQLIFDGTWVYGKSGHVAYDWGMPEGTPILAAADGLVIKAVDQGQIRCGKELGMVDHSLVVRLFHENAPDGNDYQTFYLHLSRIDVKEGQRVTAGTVIGLSGNTGCSHGPHLHFGVSRVLDTVKYEGFSVDPYGWSGASPDPRGAQGFPSVWLWKEGREPPLQRWLGAKNSLGPVRLLSVVATDALEPLDGEYVEFGLTDGAPATSLRGWKLRAGTGVEIPLPNRRIEPGETLRVWTHRTPDRLDEDTFGRAEPLWDDTGECVQLLDPTGAVTATVAFGRAGTRAECRAAVEPSLD
ncbi:MAG: peptidoglycan DD-metalloendopeptidase family protein [Myxococcota bacterium]